MEPNFTSWNLSAAEFVPSGFGAAPEASNKKPGANKQAAPKEKGKKSSKHPEEKKIQHKKESISFAVVGPQGSGKSTLVNSLTGGGATLIPAGRIATKDSRSRKYVIFDSNPDMYSLIFCCSTADFLIIVLEFDNTDREYLQNLAITLKNYAAGRVIVVLNKMDNTRWENSAFGQKVNETRRIFDKQGLNDSVFIPVSFDINVQTKVSKEISPWYNGKSLLQILDTTQPLTYKSDKGIKMPIVKITSDPRPSFVGKLTTGVLTPQTKLMLAPSGQKIEIAGMFDLQNNEIERAKAGDVVKLSFRNYDEATTGTVLCEAHELCVSSKEFKAEVHFFDLASTEVRAGQGFMIHLHSCIEEAELLEVISAVDLVTKEKSKSGVIKNDQKAIVVLKMRENICAENASKGWDALGKFALLDQGKVIGVGKIQEMNNRVDEVAADMGF